MDHFFKFDGVEGESRDSKHKGEIDVLSWSWGLSSAVTSAGGGSGRGSAKAKPTEFTFTHMYDVASPALLQLVATGRHVKTAILTARRTGGKDGARLPHEGRVVSGVADGVLEAGITEVVTIWPKHIEFQYRPRQNPDGSSRHPDHRGVAHRIQCCEVTAERLAAAIDHLRTNRPNDAIPLLRAVLAEEPGRTAMCSTRPPVASRAGRARPLR